MDTSFCFATFTLFVASILLTSLQAARGINHTVGGSTGWRVPQNQSFYTDWTNGSTFIVGDTLVFRMVDKNDDIAGVSRSEYEACSIQSSEALTYSTREGRVGVQLGRSGNWYFISTTPARCLAGEKLKINVAAKCGNNKNVEAEESVRMGGGRGAGGGGGGGNGGGGNSGTPRGTRVRPPDKAGASTLTMGFIVRVIMFIVVCLVVSEGR